MCMDTIVRVTKLPCGVNGVTVPDEKGNYNMYINKNLSYEMQLKTYQHEMKHITQGDFLKEESVKYIERELRINMDKPIKISRKKLIKL